ncbi:hypothetical protein NQT62_09410 [Limnobacter humi]|uniref:PH domain-containing protein n=1 Tax=Limnobacter humi TaxID=1778671 RepID=A0ABT1WIE8_9BURK|nr:hypothetical protein [Limnobacter humi]MCQ8896648.1 hypothetical protein [Limnobacter humi]
MPDFQTATTLDMSCTERELLRWLDMIASVVPRGLVGASTQDFLLEGGLGRVAWTPLPDRVIALVRMKRLEVLLQFTGDVTAQARAKFVKTFELYTLRGGG